MTRKILQVQAGIDRNAIQREVSRIAALNALAEQIDNTFDAGSLHCNIYTDDPKNPTKVTIVDTGSGMADSSLKAFFVYGKSAWLTKRHKGTNGKGSKYMLWHAQQIVVRTRSEGESAVKTFTVDLETWMQQILLGKTVPIKTDSVLGEHDLDPSDGTFTLIEITPKKDKSTSFAESRILDVLPHP